MKKIFIRENYIDHAKGIGIILVIIAHIISEANLSSLNILHKTIYSFHMPLFFFISGFCISLKPNKNFSLCNKIKKITTNLILPYIIWSTIYAFLAETILQKKTILSILTTRGIAPLWFLGSLAICEIIFYTIKKIHIFTKNKKETFNFISICVLSLLISFLLNTNIVIEYINTKHYFFQFMYITIGRFFFSFAFLIIGYLFGKLNIITKMRKYTLIIISILLMITTFYLTYKNNLTINLHLFEISKYTIFIITSLLGSISILFFSKFINNKTLNYIGQNSLGLMILHYIPFPTMSYSIKLSSLFTSNEIIICIVSTIICIIISITANYIIKENLLLKK